MGTARATHMSNENIVMTLQNSLTCLVKNEVTTLLSQQIVRLREQFLNRLSTTLGSELPKMRILPKKCGLYKLRHLRENNIVIFGNIRVSLGKNISTHKKNGKNSFKNNKTIFYLNLNCIFYMIWDPIIKN